MIGYLIGNYKITAKIGEGGMGDVFKGLDIMLEREIAIKMLRPELSRQQTIVERFRAEAVTLAKLNHPNIATLYNFVRQDNDYFMVMEYVKGHTLENIIKKSGAIPYQRAVQLFAQALEGIAHAHRLNIIHRDLKPANVMLMDSGLVKVMDFGIARVLGNSRITRTGNVIGTMEYMSPEQIRGEETDARSDIYSLGILLYEMLTGRVPFECNSEYELMRRQVEDAPIPPRTFTKEIPLAVEQVIMRALAKRPEARFQTADEFRAVLIKSLGDATAKLVIPASNLATEIPQQAPQQVPQQISQNSKPLAEAQNSFAQASTSAAKKKLPDTLDFSSEPPKEVKETRLADDAQAQQILKETRLAEEAQARLLEQQIKETRLANQQQQQNQQQPIPWQNPLYQQSYADAKIAPQDFRKPKTSSVEAFLNKLSWKHYVAAVLLALLSIPVAFIASSSNTPEPNANQSRSAKNVSGLSGQRNEPANSTEPPAETPAQQPAANPEPVSGTDTITPVSPNDSTDAPAKPSTGGKRARRASSTPQPVEAKRRDDSGSDKKDEKKGGIFGKLKGGLKKINPFKKD